jgi:hypothetical protein
VRQKAAPSVTSWHLPMIAQIAVGSNNRKQVRQLIRVNVQVSLLRYKGARIARSRHPKKGNAIADRDLIDG